MKRTIFILLALVLVLSALVACGGQVEQAVEEAAPTVAAVVEEVAPTVEAAVEEAVEEAQEAAEEPEPTAEPEPTEEPTEEPVEEAAEFDPAALDEGFATFLSGMEAYNTISADALLAELTEDQPPFLLDVRTQAELEEKGHIEGAYFITLRELGQNLDKLPSFDTPIVAYCGSGWRATIAMTALSALGWEDVTALKETFDNWVDAGNPVAEGLPEEAPVLDAAAPDADLAALYNEVLSNVPEGYGVLIVDDLNLLLAEEPDMTVLDVRRLEEVEEKGVVDTGEVAFAHIALEEMINEKANWPADKAAKLSVYCGSGHRSTMAMTMLWAYLYEDVLSLKGGFGAWEEAGYPVVEFEPAQ